MNNKLSYLKKALYIILPLVLIAFIVIKLKSNKEVTQSKVYQYDKTAAIHVQADTLQLKTITAGFSYTGTFEPNKETKISADIQGKINTILVDVGNIVNKGQSIVLLDNSLLKLQLQTIDVQIEGFETDVKRYTILTDADAIQGVQLEKATLGLKSAKIQRATILEQINKTAIKAPFKGIVTAKLTEEGAYAAPGIPLLQITDISKLKFTVNVSEKEVGKFKLNYNYTIIADAYSDIPLTGKVIMIGSKANMGSSYPIQIEVNNTNDLKIKSGMFGSVELNNNIQEKGISIPASAIIGSAEQPQVYLLKNGKATLQNITISNRIQDKAIVSSGLQANDIIITNGLVNLFEGANVVVN